MDALVRAAPPPGSAQAGDLYVDLQSRTLWLGVDPAVDPASFVLISDIVALQDEIEGSLVEAKAYTDTQLLTRAPTVHTHTSTQITDFAAAVQAVMAGVPSSGVNRGVIVMFSGSQAEIGVGIWAGWALCDGGNGTPNLVDKFILCAGVKVVGATNPLTSLTTSSADGVHTHTINSTTLALSLDHMPSHSHTGVTGYVSSDHQHYQGGTFATGGFTSDHTHGYSKTGGGGSSGFGTSGSLTTSSASTTGGSSSDHAHYVTISGLTGGITANHNHGIPAQGSSAAQTHDHTANSAGGAHNHTITSTQLKDTTPYYALAFIMKL